MRALSTSSRWSLAIGLALAQGLVAQLASADTPPAAAPEQAPTAPEQAPTAPVEDPLPPDWLAPRTRLFGVGTAFGAGFSGSDKGMSFALLFPTLELQIFLPSEYSIDISVPLLNMAIVMGTTDSVLFGADAYFNINAGRQKGRFIFGPGLGFAILEADSPYASNSYKALKLDLQMGYESLSKTRRFGFKTMVRPWVEIPVERSFSGPRIGGGLLAEVAFSGYLVSGRSAE